MKEHQRPFSFPASEMRPVFFADLSGSSLRTLRLQAFDIFGLAVRLRLRDSVVNKAFPIK
jgi:hypothetical protein